MPQTRCIPTTTELYKYTDRLEIFTYYNDQNCLVQAFISDVVDVINAVPYIENELLMVICDPTVDFYINDNGDLIATGTGADKYQVDQQSGQLQAVLD